MKSAHHRATLVPLLVAMIINKVDNTAIIVFQMNFGGVKGPFDFPDIITESVTGLKTIYLTLTGINLKFILLAKTNYYH